MSPPPLALARRGLAMRERALSAAQEPAAQEPVRIGLWLPLTPLFWLLAPFALLLAPLLVLAPPLRWRNPFVLVIALGRVLVALGGTEVSVDAREARVRIKIL